MKIEDFNFAKGEEIRRNNPYAKVYEEATKSLVISTLWSNLIRIW